MNFSCGWIDREYPSLNHDYNKVLCWMRTKVIYMVALFYENRRNKVNQQDVSVSWQYDPYQYKNIGLTLEIDYL